MYTKIRFILGWLFILPLKLFAFPIWMILTLMDCKAWNDFKSEWTFFWKKGFDDCGPSVPLG